MTLQDIQFIQWTEGVTGPSASSAALRPLLADVFTLYLKTKNFHWHMSGRHFRDYHLLLDEHAYQLFAMTDAIAERTRKVGGTTLRSISDIAGQQRLKDSDEVAVAPERMLSELCSDDQQLAEFPRSAHRVCVERDDIATASLVEGWIDEAETRAWFLSETAREL
jgi:starvation-inducible DNA-binding protein